MTEKADELAFLLLHWLGLLVVFGCVIVVVAGVIWVLAGILLEGLWKARAALKRRREQ